MKTFFRNEETRRLYTQLRLSLNLIPNQSSIPFHETGHQSQETLHLTLPPAFRKTYHIDNLL